MPAYGADPRYVVMWSKAGDDDWKVIGLYDDRESAMKLMANWKTPHAGMVTVFELWTDSSRAIDPYRPAENENEAPTNG